MLRLTDKTKKPEQAAATVTLTLDQRVKSRLRVFLNDGREAGIFLGRGESLKNGDCLVGEDGIVVQVEAALERVSKSRAETPICLPVPAIIWATATWRFRSSPDGCAICTITCSTTWCGGWV